MQPKTSRLLMLLVGAVISGCASQTDRSSSGGAQTQADAKPAAEAPASQPPAPQPASAPQPVPAYEPVKEPVQYVDRPLEESAPPKAAVAAVAAKEEATPDFPVTTYELPEDQATDVEVDDLDPQEDEFLYAEDEAVLAGASSIDESTEDADDLADSDLQEDESVLAEQEAAPAEDSLVDESPEDADDLETADSDTEEAVLAEDASIDETSEDADALETADSDEAEYLETRAEVSAPEEKQVVAKDEPVPDFPVTKYELPKEPAPKAAPVAPVAPKSVTVNFETEPLFNFDKSTIRADQSAKLDELISGLGGTRYDSISVVGHADRIGKDAYNQKLSERRAAAVKAYLVKKGVPSDKIQTEGRGESDSVTGDACNKTRGKALISCLQPDRRVDVSVSGTKQSN